MEDIKIERQDGYIIIAIKEATIKKFGLRLAYRLVKLVKGLV